MSFVHLSAHGLARASCRRWKVRMLCTCSHTHVRVRVQQMQCAARESSAYSVGTD
jgi:hypothetical protein